MRENELKDAHAYIDKLEQFAATPLAFFDCGYHFRRSPGTTQIRKNSIIENDTTCSVITIARGSVARYLHGSCASDWRQRGWDPTIRTAQQTRLPLLRCEVVEAHAVTGSQDRGGPFSRLICRFKRSLQFRKNT